MAEDRKAELRNIENEIRQMRVTMDMYFQGIERQPPHDELAQLKKKVQRMRGESSRWSTVDKFKMNSLAQKLTTFSQMWEKELTAMENGTSRRQKAKLDRKKKQEQAEWERQKKEMAARGGSPEALAEQQRMMAEALGEQPAAAAAPAKRKRPAAAGGGGGMSDEKMRRLYNVYMQAKKRTGERSNLSYEKLAAQINKQIPAIKKKHKCDNVDFKVVLKNGKAMLKAVPK